MKKMRRMAAAVLALGMALALTACGGKEQTVTYRGETETGGIHTNDTMTFTAKGDKIVSMKEETEFDLSSFSEEEQAQMEENLATIVEQSNAVDGVTCSGSLADGKYTIKLEVDTTGDALTKLSEMGVVAIQGDGNGLSLKLTASGLENQGYEKVE